LPRAVAQKNSYYGCNELLFFVRRIATSTGIVFLLCSHRHDAIPMPTIEKDNKIS
jgi:hypothetical protein